MSETPHVGTCQLCRQTRPLFDYSDIPQPWETATDYELCARCWSRADSAEYKGDPLELSYLCREAKRQTDALNTASARAKVA